MKCREVYVFAIGSGIGTKFWREKSQLRANSLAI